jgi:hypothetical protein
LPLKQAAGIHTVNHKSKIQKIKQSTSFKNQIPNGCRRLFRTLAPLYLEFVCQLGFRYWNFPNTVVPLPSWGLLLALLCEIASALRPRNDPQAGLGANLRWVSDPTSLYFTKQLLQVKENLTFSGH